MDLAQKEWSLGQVIIDGTMEVVKHAGCVVSFVRLKPVTGCKFPVLRNGVHVSTGTRVLTYVLAYVSTCV